MSRTWILTALLGALLLTVIIINILILVNRYRRRALKTMQQDLEETQEEVHELVQELAEVKPEPSHDNMKALYQRIEQAMTGKHLYLIPDLDIKMLAEEVCSSRSSISQCINSITGKTFRNWLSEYRLNLFVQMLKQYPNEPIDELIIRCGYKEQSTFRRQFKAAFDMAPSDYRKRLANRDKE